MAPVLNFTSLLVQRKSRTIHIPAPQPPANGVCSVVFKESSTFSFTSFSFTIVFQINEQHHSQAVTR